jgi:hypothetical protein
MQLLTDELLELFPVLGTTGAEGIFSEVEKYLKYVNLHLTSYCVERRMGTRVSWFRGWYGETECPHNSPGSIM